MKIELRKGDITNQPGIDAIVNAANTELWLGSGVAGAISARGGPEIEREAVAQGPIALGEAVRTTAANLPNEFVIHAAAMGYREEDRAVPKREGSASSETIIRDATINSISIADKSGCSSIAFPALATGVGGFPVNECARVMMKASQDYADEHPQSEVERVIFVLFTASDFQVFERELKTIEKTNETDASENSCLNPDSARLHVALVEPEIPPNTGNIARLCAATFTPLHLVGKLGFRTDDKAVRRAGLDYWSEVEIHYHLNIEALYAELPGCRYLYFTTKAERAYTSFQYAPGDCLVFGSETRGLPERICCRQTGSGLLRFPCPTIGCALSTWQRR